MKGAKGRVRDRGLGGREGEEGEETCFLYVCAIWAQVVLGVLNAAKSRVLKRWKLLDNSITDANNEAKDNVKYLSTLEKYIEPLRVGNPETILDSLPGLLNNIKMMHTIARYYNTSERMTLLFRKITNQMIWNCRHHILGADPSVKLWDQDIPQVGCCSSSVFRSLLSSLPSLPSSLTLS